MQRKFLGLIAFREKRGPSSLHPISALPGLADKLRSQYGISFEPLTLTEAIRRLKTLTKIIIICQHKSTVTTGLSQNTKTW